MYFRAFTRNGSAYVAANPVMVPIVSASNNSGKIVIERYNSSGTLVSSTEDYAYNLLSKTVTQQSVTVHTYTKQILGLDDVIYEDCYRFPIFKNNGDLYNTAVTIKRMPKDVAVTRGNDTFYFRYYRQMNNRYVRMRWYHALGESVFIRCQIEENAEGYIYGNTSGANIFVYKNGSTHKIQWRNGTTPLLSIDCDDKRHDIGFVGVIPDLSSFAGRKMYPFCDGVTYDTIEITTTVSPYYARVGGVIDGTTNSACIHSSGSWAIRIYEVYAYSFMFDDLKALYTFTM